MICGTHGDAHDGGLQARTLEKLVNFYQTTWRYKPEDSHLRTETGLLMKLKSTEMQPVFATVSIKPN
jgi:hypothetical protein